MLRNMINVVRTKRIIRQMHSINNNNNNNNMKYMLTKILGNNNNNTYNNHNHGINNQSNSFHTTTSMFYAYQKKKGKAERAINRGKSKFKMAFSTAATNIHSPDVVSKKWNIRSYKKFVIMP